MNGEEQLIFQKELARFIMNDVFNTITEEDVLKQTKEGWTHKGILLTEGQIKLLKKEASIFQQSHLYKVLFDELNWYARSYLEKAKSESDMLHAKLLSFFADVIKTKVKKIAEI